MQTVRHRNESESQPYENGISAHPGLIPMLEEFLDWHYCQVLFRYGDKDIALCTAFYSGKEWVSLPHFNQSAIIIYYDNLEAGIDKSKVRWRIIGLFSHYLNDADKGRSVKTKCELTQTQLFHGEEGPILKDFFLREVYSLGKIGPSHKSISVLRLKNDAKEQLAEFSSPVRRKISKAFRNGIKIIHGRDELLGDYYKLYRYCIHRLGSIGLPFSFFELLLKHVPESRLFLAKYNDKIIGAAVLVCWQDFAENPWFAGLRGYNKYYTSYALHYQMIDYAIKNACSLYSFGRSSRDSGVEKFKNQWNTDLVDLFYNGKDNQPFLKSRGFIGKIIKLVPLCFMKRTDRVVSRYIY